MRIDDKIKDEKLQYDINRETAKYQRYHLEKLINMNILKVKKYCHLIKTEQQNKLSLNILLQEIFLKNKKKTIEGQGKKTN